MSNTIVYGRFSTDLRFLTTPTDERHYQLSKCHNDTAILLYNDDTSRAVALIHHQGKPHITPENVSFQPGWENVGALTKTMWMRACERLLEQHL